MKKQLVLIGTISALVLSSCSGSNENDSTDDSSNDSTEMNTMDEEDAEPDTEEVDNSEMDVVSGEWDEVLDDYEDYVDTYVVILKKLNADPTDMSVMTEYQELMEKSTDWSEKMSSMSADFGDEQMSRFLEIQKKFSTMGN